jgi:transcriptional regulator with XRE-family HTH domain
MRKLKSYTLYLVIMDTVQTPIGEQLKSFRRNKGMSQERLAEASRISIRTIQRIENGSSTGSAYTVAALARALQVEITDLYAGEELNRMTMPEGVRIVKMMNLVALAVIIVPLTNILFPAILFRKNRHDKTVGESGGKILSFQILWTLMTILMMVILPALLPLFFHSLQGASIPLFIPVYYIAILVNIAFVIRFAAGLNSPACFLNKIPNLL